MYPFAKLFENRSLCEQRFYLTATVYGSVKSPFVHYQIVQVDSTFRGTSRGLNPRSYASGAIGQIARPAGLATTPTTLPPLEFFEIHKRN